MEVLDIIIHLLLGQVYQVIKQRTRHFSDVALRIGNHLFPSSGYLTASVSGCIRPLQASKSLKLDDHILCPLQSTLLSTKRSVLNNYSGTPGRLGCVVSRGLET